MWKNRKFNFLEEERIYPFIQFMSSGASIVPAQHRGKFAITEEQVLALLTNGAEKDAIPQNAEPLELVFNNGHRTSAYVADGLVVVPILTRFAWLKDGFRLPGYTKGAHGKLQLLCYVVNNADRFIGPLMLTVSGLASKDLKNALREHGNTVRKATRGQAPAYAFSMLLKVGDPVMRGSKQQSRACPIILDKDWETGLVENPDSYYIGDKLVDVIEARQEEFKTWSAAWSKSGPNGDGEVAGSEPEPVESKPSPVASVASQDTSVTRTTPAWYNTELPFRTRKYPDGTTLGDIYEADDSASLKILVPWCKQHGYPKIAEYAGKALDALQSSPF